MTYYDRQIATHLDGTPIFATAEDKQAERDIAALCEQAWHCEIKPFGTLSPVDWFALKDGRIVGVLEVKNRSKASTTYPTLWLNVRKWLALALTQAGTGVPAIYVVRFTDGIRWIPINHIDASRIVMGGCKRVVKATSDVEPVIEIPIEEFKVLKGTV